MEKFAKWWRHTLDFTTTNCDYGQSFTRSLGRVRNRVREKLNSTTHYTTRFERVLCAKLRWNVFPRCPTCIKSVTLLLTAVSVEKTVIMLYKEEKSDFPYVVFSDGERLHKARNVPQDFSYHRFSWMSLASMSLWHKTWNQVTKMCEFTLEKVVFRIVWQ